MQQWQELLGEEAPTSKPNGHAPVREQNVVVMEGGEATKGASTTDTNAATSDLVDRIAAGLDRFIFLENRRIYPLIVRLTT